MPAIRFGVAVVAVALACGAATAQPPPWVGGPIPPGQLFGYSPLVHTVEPFPSKTSPYSYSMFLPGVGGKRVYPSLVTDPRRPCPAYIIEVRDAPRVPTGRNLASTAPVRTAAAFEPVGPVARPLPAQGLHRFAR